MNGFKGAEPVAQIVTPESAPEGREPRLARRSPFTRAMKLCPRCLTPLGPIQNPIGELWGIVPTNYQCPKCGYAGTVFLEKEPDSETE